MFRFNSICDPLINKRNSSIKHYLLHYRWFLCFNSSLIPRLHSRSLSHRFIYGAIKCWGVESGNEATSTVAGSILPLVTSVDVLKVFTLLLVFCIRPLAFSAMTSTVCIVFKDLFYYSVADCTIAIAKYRNMSCFSHEFR